ncbi:ABC transporter substrate-binding protein [Cryptosporangium phraense]|uniref:ABC transporter substrate-binding protein n=1 Tax=Cryptosporangium phraense TaxID=2593070 RepID=A0A545AU40_9ACTN|nr:ABC transporter substrate-binding protein [Cryptosporangium phraense]
MAGLAAAVGVALVLSACGGPDNDNARDAAKGYDPDAKVTITWWTGQQEPQMEKAAENLAAEYQRKHKNVTIKTSAGAQVTDDLLPKLTSSFNNGSYPDVSYAFGSWAGQLAATGKTQDLADFVRDPEFDFQDFPKAAQETATVNGVVIGIPALVDNIGLIYNKALFKEAGVALPNKRWSWEQFRIAAKKLTDEEKGVYGTAYSISGSEDTTWHLWPLLWQHGGLILNGKKPAFNNEAGVAALETLRQMAVDDKSMFLDQTDEKYPQMFANGKIGMMMSGPWELLGLSDTNIDYGVTQLPGYNGDHQTVSGPDLWVLFNHDNANRAGASRDFIKWLTSKDVDAKFNLAIGNLPLRGVEQTTMQFAAYAQEYPGGREFFNNLENARQARPTVPGYAEMSKYVGAAIAKVLKGQAKPQQALDDAAVKSAPALEGS